MLKRFFKEEDGMGVVEVLLIIVVLVGLVAIFKDQIGGFVENIWINIQETSNTVIS